MNELGHHAAFSAYLKKQNILHVHARTDQKSGIAVGWPDYTLFLPGGRVLLIEFKQRGKKPTEEQEATIAALRASGHDVRVLFDHQTAIMLVEDTEEATEAPAASNEASEPKIWVTPSKSLGYVVVAKNQAGHLGALRVASEADMINLPRLPLGIVCS